MNNFYIRSLTRKPFVCEETSLAEPQLCSPVTVIMSLKERHLRVKTTTSEWQVLVCLYHFYHYRCTSTGAVIIADAIVDATLAASIAARSVA